VGGSWLEGVELSNSLERDRDYHRPAHIGDAELAHDPLDVLGRPNLPRLP